jgi:hypothetical protein
MSETVRPRGRGPGLAFVLAATAALALAVWAAGLSAAQAPLFEECFDRCG